MIFKKQMVALVFLLSACSGVGHKTWSGGNFPASAENISKYSAVLDKAETGRTYNTTTASGRSVSFTVEAEYLSANRQQCKKFVVNNSLKLACKANDKWVEKKAFR